MVSETLLSIPSELLIRGGNEVARFQPGPRTTGFR